MLTKVIPYKEIEIKVYALQYATGALYAHSSDNSNQGKKDKKTNTVINHIFITPAYTYEGAVDLLNKDLLKNHDLYIGEVRIIKHACSALTSLFDVAYERYGNKKFESKEE